MIVHSNSHVRAVGKEGWRAREQPSKDGCCLELGQAIRGKSEIEKYQVSGRERLRVNKEAGKKGTANQSL